MSSLPPRIIVSSNQYAMAVDVNALQYLETAYHNMIAASSVGCSLEGEAGVLNEARGNGAIVSGCNVKYDPVSKHFGILNGTAVMFNQTIDNSDNPTLPLYPFSKSLVAVLAQTIQAPAQRAQPGWSVIYLKKQDYTFSQIRDFLNTSTGGTSPQNTPVLYGAIGVANLHSAWGPNSDPANAYIMPPEFTNYGDDIITLAIVFIPETGKDILPEYVFDARPLISRKTPWPGEWKMTAKMNVDTGVGTADANQQARVCFQRMHSRDSIASMQHGEWLASSQVPAGAPEMCTIHTTSTAYTPADACVDLPALNVVFEDGSFRRVAPLNWGNDTLQPRGSDLNGLPFGLNWLYVYACRSKTLNTEFFVLSIHPPDSVTYGSSVPEHTGMRLFPAPPPKPINQFVVFDDVIGRCVGILPIDKQAAIQFIPSTWNGNKLTFDFPVRTTLPLLPDTGVRSAGINVPFNLPAYGISTVELSFTGTVDTSVPPAPAHVGSRILNSITTVMSSDIEYPMPTGSTAVWPMQHRLIESFNGPATTTYRLEAYVNAGSVSLVVDESGYVGQLDAKILSVELPDCGLPILGAL